MENFKVIIVEDVPLDLKGTEGIFKTDIPEAEIIGTAENEPAYWRLIKAQKPDLVLLDLGLGGSTTIGVEICRSTKQQYPDVKVLIFTGEILNEKLWVDALDAGCDGIILKSGELLTRGAGIAKEDIPSRIIYMSKHDQRYYLTQMIEKQGTVEALPLNNWRFVPEEWTKPAIERDRRLIFKED